jgi:hypothetical protein
MTAIIRANKEASTHTETERERERHIYQTDTSTHVMANSVTWSFTYLIRSS